MKKRLTVLAILAGGAWLANPDSADAQGVCEGGIGYEIASSNMSDYLNGGVNFALLLGYRFQQRYTVSFFGSLSLLTGKTVSGVPGFPDQGGFAGRRLGGRGGGCAVRPIGPLAVQEQEGGNAEADEQARQEPGEYRCARGARAAGATAAGFLLAPLGRHLTFPRARRYLAGPGHR